MEPTLLTHEFTLVPSSFFNPESARELLAEVVDLSENAVIRHMDVAHYGAVLIYSDVSGGSNLMPEMFCILRDLPSCPDYNKVLCSWMDDYVYLAIAQGRNLSLANAYRAVDFATAEYYVFLAMKSLQLNPEVTTICWRTPLGPDEEMSLYRYFKSVEHI